MKAVLQKAAFFYFHIFYTFNYFILPCIQKWCSLEFIRSNL